MYLLSLLHYNKYSIREGDTNGEEDLSLEDREKAKLRFNSSMEVFFFFFGYYYREIIEAPRERKTKTVCVS